MSFARYTMKARSIFCWKRAILKRRTSSRLVSPKWSTFCRRINAISSELLLLLFSYILLLLSLFFFLTLYLLLLFHPDATESNFCRQSFDGEDTTRSKWRRDELKEREGERERERERGREGERERERERSTSKPSTGRTGSK